MDDQKVRVFRAASEFVLLAIITSLPALTVFLDIEVFSTQLLDRSLTEYVQEGLLAISALLLWHAAWKAPAARGFLALAAGFFTCMLIREFDEPLNRVADGLWLYPALAAAAGSVGLARACRGTVLAPMAAFVGTKPYYHLFFGMLVVLVFSRVFGSGSLLWEPIMESDYKYAYRSGIQEGLEQFGYIFIFYGSWTLRRQNRAAGL